MIEAEIVNDKNNDSNDSNVTNDDTNDTNDLGAIGQKTVLAVLSEDGSIDEITNDGDNLTTEDNQVSEVQTTDDNQITEDNQILEGQVSDDNQISYPQDEPSYEINRKKIALYEKWVTFFVKDGIGLDDGKLVCTICRKEISADKKSRLSEHINSKKHKKMVDLPEDQRPQTSFYEPYTPISKKQKLSNGLQLHRTYSKVDQGLPRSKRDARDKSHEILLADILNLFINLDIPFDKLNTEVWKTFVKKHIKNGELIIKNFQFYKSSS